MTHNQRTVRASRFRKTMLLRYVTRLVHAALREAVAAQFAERREKLSSGEPVNGITCDSISNLAMARSALHGLAMHRFRAGKVAEQRAIHRAQMLANNCHLARLILAINQDAGESSGYPDRP